MEGNFRYCHVRTATNGESIAFYGGGGLEKTIADDSFEEVYEQKKKLNITNFRFGGMYKLSCTYLQFLMICLYLIYHKL